MRVTIIPSDSVVYVDGVARAPINLDFMSDIHAVQWYDTWGEVERYDENRHPSNERIESLTPYQAAIDGWNNWVAPTPPAPKPDPWPPVVE